MRYNIFKIPSQTDPKDWVQDTNGKINVIVLDSTDYDNYKDLLEKMMAAVGINLQDQCLLIKVKENEELSISEIFKSIKAERLFIFGIPFAQIGIQIDESNNRIYKFEKMKVITATSLTAIADNPAEKRSFWNVLKSFMNNG